MYLNDVPEGGGTRFNNLDLTVKPKKGAALIWPSVQDQRPHDKDERTMHEAMPVIEGVKYGTYCSSENEFDAMLLRAVSHDLLIHFYRDRSQCVDPSEGFQNSQ
jgi:hypothetical protein